MWSLSLRKGGAGQPSSVQRLSALIGGDEDLALTELILQEVLQAFWSEATFRKIVAYLEPFPLLELTRTDYIAAARLHRKCAAKGIAITTADCQIASAAIQHGCFLLTADKDFERIAGISVLRLV